MNTNNSARAFLVPTAIAIVLALGLSVGAYFWWPNGPPSKEDPKDPPITKNGKANETAISAKPAFHDATPVSFDAALDFLDSEPEAQGMDPLIRDPKRSAALRGLVYKNEKEPF